MQKHRAGKRFLKAAVCLLLTITVLFTTAYPLLTFAEDTRFSGIEEREVEENQPFDLLQGVTAVGDDGAQLPVRVKRVTSSTGESYDNVTLLSVGAAGTIYEVEYVASPMAEEATEYTAQRRLVSVAPQGNGETSETELPGGGDAVRPEEGGDTALPEDGENPVPPAQGEDTVPPQDGADTTLPEGSGEAVPPQEDEGQQPGDPTVPEPPQNIASTELPIIFEGGLHYVEDPDYPGERIVLYCMNNQLAWPHSTGEHPHVPNYTQGYLTPDKFASPEAYQACMQKLRKLLFAGYPYNGERLYKIVENSEMYVPTAQEFNGMLIVPPQLQTGFPYLGHHDFTLADLNHPKHMEELSQFMNDVAMLHFNGGTTANGLTYADITSMPFYKAANAMTFGGANVTEKEVLQNFAGLYSSSYFVTEAQAYDATRDAVWRLMYEYGVENNDFQSVEHNELAKVLWQYCQHGDLLTEAPSMDKISVRGDLEFHYNPKDGMWHSGQLYIEEPAAYNGLYRLSLPAGVTAICENLTYVYGNEAYELVSKHPPKNGEEFKIESHIDWLKDMRQYSPVNSTEFQHMVGAVIRHTTFTQDIAYSAADEGSLAITKTVDGTQKDLQTEFFFQLELTETKLNGRYGDFEFHDGIAYCTLKNGETKTAANLPANVPYKVTEVDHRNYQVDSTNAEGTIQKGQTVSASFHNTRLLDLRIDKTVEGDLGDRTKPFTFVVELSDAQGKPLQGTYSCVYYEPAGSTNGTLSFADGRAEVQLTHGQQVQILGIPYRTTYTVTEKEANQDGYKTTYNDAQAAASGTLDAPAQVHVVNSKTFIPPTGVHHIGHPWIGTGLCLAAAGLVLPLLLGVVRRKKGRGNGR